MQFSIIGEWLIQGRSPHTGQPVKETCRLVDVDHLSWPYPDRPEEIYAIAKYGRGFDDPPRIIYEGGKTYAIQPGRGQKAIGRTPPIASIRRQDVREMTRKDAQARGFFFVTDYLMVWTSMHDKQMTFNERFIGQTSADKRFYFDRVATFVGLTEERLMEDLRERPAERYQAWVIRFA